MKPSVDISDDAFKAALLEMAKSATVDQTSHPFSRVIRTLAEAMGVSHLVWAFGVPVEGGVTMIAGTTCNASPAALLALTAFQAATKRHAKMRGEKLNTAEPLDVVLKDTPSATPEAPIERARAQVLVDALSKCEQRYRNVRNAIGNLEPSNRIQELTFRRVESALHEADGLLGCLRRLVPHATPNQVYRAFGAPGDFGYYTVIGDALARVYGLRGIDDVRVEPEEGGAE